MADVNSFNTTPGAAIERKMMILYLNTGAAETPVWSPIGRRVVDSSMAFDWSKETNTDILGVTRTNVKAPILNQTFEPCELDAEDAAQYKIWIDAVKKQDLAAVVNQDLLVIHTYEGSSTTGVFAERYPNSAVLPSSLGGSSHLGMPIDVTFGGERSVGTAKSAAGVLTFTADEAA